MSNDFQQFEDRYFEIFVLYFKNKNVTFECWAIIKQKLSIRKIIKVALLPLIILIFEESLINQYNEHLYPIIFGHKKVKVPENKNFELAYSLFIQGNLDSAFWIINTVIEDGNISQRSYSLRGDINFEFGRYDAAIEDYTKVIDEKEQSDIYFKRGLSYSSLNDHKKAIDDYNSAIKINDFYFIYYFHRSLSFKSLKQYDEAEKDLRKVIALNPYFPYNYHNLANIYGDQGLADSAISNYLKTLIYADSTYLPKESFLSGAINKSLIYTNLGREYRKVGKVDKAVESLLKAHDLDSNNAVSNYELGVQLDDFGFSEIALRHFNKCLILDPGMVQAHHSLSIVYEHIGQLDKAWESINKAIEVDPSNSIYIDRRKEIENAINSK